MKDNLSVLMLSLVDDYKEFMSTPKPSDEKAAQAEREFLARVLGPDQLAWLDRGERYGYGRLYDPDEYEED